MMMAGLIQSKSRQSLDQIPGLKKLPILGALFQSRDFIQEETELVVIVTPYLVKPVNANEIVLPTDAFRSANDVQRLLINQETDGVSGGDRPKPSVENIQNGGGRPVLGSLNEQAPAPAPTDKQERKKLARNKSNGKAGPGFSFE